MPLETVADASKLDLETYVWEVPGAPVRVHIQRQVIQTIDSYLRQTPPGVHPGAVQKGGILLGNMKAPGEPNITSFQPLTSVSSSDIAAALTSMKNGGPGTRPIGYFRTHSKGRFCLSTAEIALAERFFFDPACVFLLIGFSRDGSAKAGFFFWDNGYLNADFCFLEFPFSTGVMAVEPLENPAARSQQSVEMAPAPPQVLRPRAPHMLPSAASEINAAAPAERNGSSQSRSEPDEGGWHETASSNLMSDGSPRLIQSPRKAVLEQKGALQIRWTIPIAVSFFFISMGSSFVYFRTGQSLGSSSGHGSSSVSGKTAQVASPPIAYGTIASRSTGSTTNQPTPAKTAASSATAPPPAASRQTKISRVLSTHSQAVPLDAPIEPSTNGDREKVSVEDHFPGEAAPKAQILSRPISVSPSPISLNPVTSNVTNPPPISALIPAVAPPAAEASRFGAPSQNPPAVRTPEPQQKLNAESPVKSATPSYLPPRAVRQVMPSMTSFGTPSNSPIAEVSVEVRIDEEGRVTDAHLTDNQPKMGKFVVYSVLRAAQQWKFEPARLGGKLVPANHVIVFRFRDPGK